MAPVSINWVTGVKARTHRRVTVGGSIGEGVEKFAASQTLSRAFTDFPRDALGSLAFLRRLAEHRGHDFPAGSLVSPGASTGVHEARIGARAMLDFGDPGNFELAPVSGGTQ